MLFTPRNSYTENSSKFSFYTEIRENSICTRKKKRGKSDVYAENHVEMFVECRHGLHFHRVVGLKSKRGGYIAVTWVGSRGLWMNRRRTRVWVNGGGPCFSLTCEERVWEGCEGVTRRKIQTHCGARGRKDRRTIPYTYKRSSFFAHRIRVSRSQRATPRDLLWNATLFVRTPGNLRRSVSRSRPFLIFIARKIAILYSYFIKSIFSIENQNWHF